MRVCLIIKAVIQGLGELGMGIRHSFLNQVEIMELLLV